MRREVTISESCEGNDAEVDAISKGEYVLDYSSIGVEGNDRAVLINTEDEIKGRTEK